MILLLSNRYTYMYNTYGDISTYYLFKQIYVTLHLTGTPGSLFTVHDHVTHTN